MNERISAQVFRASSRLVQELEAARASLETIIDTLPNIICLVEQSGQILFCSKAFFKSFGGDAESNFGRHINEFLSKKDWSLLKSKLDQVTLGERLECKIEFKNENSNNLMIFHLDIYGFINIPPNYLIIAITGNDITDILTMNSKIEQIYNCLPVGLFTIDAKGSIETPYSEYVEFLLHEKNLKNRQLIDVLSKFSNLTSEKKRELEDILSYINRPEIELNQNIKDLTIIINTKPPSQTLGSDGQWIKIQFYPIIKETNIEKYFVIIQNVTSWILQKQENEKLLAESRYDPLTTLGNRRFYEEHVNTEWRRASRMSDFISLAIIDVDFFKKYNDGYGHLAGDEILKKIGQTIRHITRREGDRAFRYGGEEFVIVLPATNESGAKALCQKLVDAILALNIEHKFRTDSLKIVSISIGTATLPTKATLNWQPSQLLAEADKSLYEAKNSGKAKVITKTCVVE